MCPNRQIRQPANRSPCDIDQIERSGCQTGCFIHPALHEVGLEPGLVGELSRCADCFRGEGETGDDRAQPHQAQRVGPDVALEVKDPFLGNVPELGDFRSMQPVLVGPHAIKPVEPGRIARMNDRAFIPGATVDLDRIGHGWFLDCRVQRS
jgi:hypothetical protein